MHWLKAVLYALKAEITRSVMEGKIPADAADAESTGELAKRRQLRRGRR